MAALTWDKLTSEAGRFRGLVRGGRMLGSELAPKADFPSIAQVPSVEPKTKPRRRREMDKFRGSLD